MSEDEFTPRLGRIRDRGKGKGRSFLNRIIAAANLARGGAPGGRAKQGFTGSRIGRGVGVGRVLAERDRFAAFRQRRVVVKSRIVRLRGKGLAGARAHLRYLQRDGVTREGAPGELYAAEQDRSDAKAFLERGAEDRHQFRFILSAEDGDAYADLKPLVRRWMAQMEDDLGTRLDWVAVDHFNTAHPHSHVILRGVDDRGADLVIARDYMAAGMRERAAELVQLDLGPRTDRDIEDRLRAEVGQERLTSIDRRLLARQHREGSVAAVSHDASRRALEIARLRKLAQLGLAGQDRSGRWQLAAGLEDALRTLGQRSDIIATLHRELGANGLDRAAGDRVIFEAADKLQRTLVGRVVARGLSDELADRHYLIVDGVDGRSHYVDIGGGDAVEPLPSNAIVRVTARPSGVREVDRTILAVAQAHDGTYDVERHLRQDASATSSFAQAHVRRLEAMRRANAGVVRNPDGSWTIAPDHLERAALYEAHRARVRPVSVEILSLLPLERLPERDSVTWLDREAARTDPEPLRDSGFGKAVRGALAARRQWLLGQGIAAENAVATLACLERKDLAHIAADIATRTGKAFREAAPGAVVSGTLAQRVDSPGGGYAMIEKSREFTLVPWRSSMERQLGKAVTGKLSAGGMDWSIGRSRGPSVG